MRAAWREVTPSVYPSSGSPGPVQDIRRTGIDAVAAAQGRVALPPAPADVAKRHVLGGALRPLFPLEEQQRVGSGDVVGGRNIQRAGGAVDPARRPFDLAKVADRRLVQD